jgi:hypothetical protein
MNLLKLALLLRKEGKTGRKYVGSMLGIWILASLLIGVLGIHKRFGFWGFFFGSLVLSPIIGVIMLFSMESNYIHGKASE